MYKGVFLKMIVIDLLLSYIRPETFMPRTNMAMQELLFSALKAGVGIKC